jgi:glycosyltransferase involved in cell wall biosynthesis
MANNTNPLVSVVVPVYNVEKYIDECLESIVGQTYKNLEIILVDDASVDGSGKKCDKWAKQDERIKVVHKTTNEGLFQARITGFELMSGDYFIAVDSDDYIAKDFVKVFLNKAISTHADIVASEGFTRVDDNDEQEREQFPKLYAEEEVLDSLLRKIASSKEKFGWNAWGKMYQYEVYKKARQRLLDISGNINAGEDILFSFIFAYFAKGSAYVPGYAGYFYRQNGQSIMHGVRHESFVKRLDNITSVMFYAENFLEEVGLLGKYKDEVVAFKEYLISDNVWAIKNEYIHLNTELQQQNTELQKSEAELKEQLHKLKDSKAYRLGRAITWPYVRIKSIFHAL